MTTADLNDHLAPLAFLVGTTWRGELSSSTPDKPVVDVMTCERALNGNAIRMLHSINDGEYGGETIIVWDAAVEQIVYYYFTTSGFYTRGTMELGDGHYTAHEAVTGNTNGITAVKSHAHRTPDGKFSTESQYFRNGEWIEGHAAMYAPAPDATVRFR